MCLGLRPRPAWKRGSRRSRRDNDELYESRRSRRDNDELYELIEFLLESIWIEFLLKTTFLERSPLRRRSRSDPVLCDANVPPWVVHSALRGSVKGVSLK